MAGATQRAHKGVGAVSYSSYARKIMWTAHSNSAPPELAVDLRVIEETAKSKLPPEVYDFACGGAGSESTVKANRDAFDNVSFNWVRYQSFRRAPANATSGVSYHACFRKSQRRGI